mgnify:CR=1 FL=1
MFWQGHEVDGEAEGAEGDSEGAEGGAEAYAGAAVEATGEAGVDGKYGGATVGSGASIGTSVGGEIGGGASVGTDGVVSAEVDIGARLGVGAEISLAVEVDTFAIAQDVYKAKPIDATMGSQAKKRQQYTKCSVGQDICSIYEKSINHDFSKKKRFAKQNQK